MAHGFHFLSVHMLYYLSLCVNPDISNTRTPKFALLAALLHIISPAGLFLSAPYAESPFSFLNFAGFFLYTRSHQEKSRGDNRRGPYLLAASGITFGLASTLRSNGLLSGLVFCYEAIDCALTLLQPAGFLGKLRRLCAVFISGFLMALGPITVQYLAYREYCVEPDIFGGTRPWCSKWLPSIYAWVQDYYWYDEPFYT